MRKSGARKAARAKRHRDQLTDLEERFEFRRREAVTFADPVVSLEVGAGGDAPRDPLDGEHVAGAHLEARLAPHAHEVSPHTCTAHAYSWLQGTR